MEATTIFLDPAPELRGLVVSSTGAPISGARIEVFRRSEVTPAREQTFSDQDGAFACYGADETLNLKVSRAGYVPEMQRLEPESLGPVVVRLKSTDAILSGRVVNERGLPVKSFGLLFHARDANNPLQFTGWFDDPQGRFEMDLLQGVYQVAVQVRDGAAQQSPAMARIQLVRQIEVKSGERQTILLQVPPTDRMPPGGTNLPKRSSNPD